MRRTSFTLKVTLIWPDGPPATDAYSLLPSSPRRVNSTPIL